MADDEAEVVGVIVSAANIPDGQALLDGLTQALVCNSTPWLCGPWCRTQLAVGRSDRLDNRRPQHRTFPVLPIRVSIASRRLSCKTMLNRLAPMNQAGFSSN